MSESALSSLLNIRQQIPALSTKRYFNYGGQGTIPAPALEKIAASYRDVQEKGPFSNNMFRWMCEELDETRRLLATELGGNPRSYAITSNVTEGCNIVLWGIDWKPGDRLLLSDSEHGGVISAVENIARRLDLRVEQFAVKEKSEEEIVAALSESLAKEPARLVLYSHVLWNTGQRLPVTRLNRIAHEAGAQVLVDGAQSAGVVDSEIVQSNCDYYAITTHKWLCGPEGIGALFIREDRLEELEPTFVGWRKDMTGLFAKKPVDGSRFEVATAPFPLLAGFREAVAFHRRYGSALEQSRLILEGAAKLRAALAATGCVEVIDGTSASSGLVTFKVSGAEPGRVVSELESQNLMLRTIPGLNAVRASVHYFTTFEEIDALVSAIANLRV